MEKDNVMRILVIFVFILFNITIIKAQNTDCQLYQGSTDLLVINFDLVNQVAQCGDDSLGIVTYINVDKQKILYHIIKKDTIGDKTLKHIINQRKKGREENFYYELYVYYSRLQKTLNK